MAKKSTRLLLSIRQPVKPQSDVPGTYKILIVDDEPVNLQVMANFLSLEKYMVYTAANGEEALRFINENVDGYFDLVVLDIMMPRISGYEICRRLRGKYSLLEMPVLMLTAKNQAEDILAGFDSGANDYLCKPFDKKELLARVNTLLNLKKIGEQEIMLRKAEVKTLQAQIKPHFLLNTLNTVVYFCRIDPEKAGELLTELSNYLRSRFDFTGDDEYVSLEHELGTVRSFLSIVQARFCDLLKIQYDIEANLNCRIPSFILEPVVENAVKHGLLPKREGGMIKISTRKEGDLLVLRVEDDGVGMTEYKVREILSLREKPDGLGVYNVNRRLKSIYGQELEIWSRPGQGTTVTIRIPFAKEDNRYVKRDVGG